MHTPRGWSTPFDRCSWSSRGGGKKVAPSHEGVWISNRDALFRSHGRARQTIAEIETHILQRERTEIGDIPLAPHFVLGEVHKRLCQTHVICRLDWE